MRDGLEREDQSERPRKLTSLLKISFLGVKLNLSSPVLGDMPTRIQLRLRVHCVYQRRSQQIDLDSHAFISPQRALYQDKEGWAARGEEQAH